jgi:hypothetical protein
MDQSILDLYTARDWAQAGVYFEVPLITHSQDREDIKTKTGVELDASFMRQIAKGTVKSLDIYGMSDDDRKIWLNMDVLNNKKVFDSFEVYKYLKVRDRSWVRVESHFFQTALHLEHARHELLRFSFLDCYFFGPQPSIVKQLNERKLPSRRFRVAINLQACSEEEIDYYHHLPRDE